MFSFNPSIDDVSRHS